MSQKLQTLEDLLGFVDDGLTKEEFRAAFEEVMRFVSNAERHVLGEIETLKAKYKDLDQFTSIAQSIRKLEDKVANEMMGLKIQYGAIVRGYEETIASIEASNAGDIAEMKQQVRDSLDSQMSFWRIETNKQAASITAKLATVHSGVDADEVKIIDAVLAKLPPPAPPVVIPPPLTGEDIRNNLEALQGDDRLEMTAIKGLAEELDKLHVVGSKPKYVPVAGATNGSATTFYAETPVGLIDGSNTTYTVAHSITSILSFAIGGIFIHPADYSVSGTTITFSTPLNSTLSGQPFTIVYS